jgi:hypothetical protein
MKQKSRIKEKASSELKALQDKLRNLPYGGLADLSELTGIDRAALSRFKNGKVIGSDKFVMIEIAMREKAA